MPAGRDRDILLALPEISHGIGDTGYRQPPLPQFLARSGVERAQIGISSSSEDESARRDRNAAEQRRSPAKGEPERREIFRGADRRMPEDFSCLQIERDHLAPWRLVA